ncbi:MAG: alpha/beta hydrolase [Dehalococcoidia bacterium]|nr:MAG: alpha/beta hydrolase [Dehalococcoidia bacterium]
MGEFIPWNSQSLDEWAKKYAPGKFINLTGHQTHYIEKGEGEPVILLHGFGSDSYSWHNNIDTLAAKFKIYALDLWGCGYSTRELLNYGYPLYAQQLLSFMNALNIERASLIGQSMGGGTIIKFTAEYRDRVKSIILVCAAGMPHRPVPTQQIVALPGLGELVLSLPTNLIRKLIVKKVYLYRKEITQEYFDGLTWSQKIKGSNEAFLRIIRLKFFHTLRDEIHHLGEMGVPTLIVWGYHDKGIPVRLGQEIHHILKGSRTEVFEKSAHEPHDEEPERFNRIALDFLS